MSLTMHDLRKLKLGSRDVLLDVRTPEEFAEGHIEGARNIPHEEVAARAISDYNSWLLWILAGHGGRAAATAEAG